MEYFRPVTKSSPLGIIGYMQTQPAFTANTNDIPMTLSLDDFEAITTEWQGLAEAEPDDARASMIAEAMASVLRHRRRVAAKHAARHARVRLWPARRQAFSASVSRVWMQLTGQSQAQAAPLRAQGN